ncbi:uncharacterized oxidoreductase At1g06690, chloroplastic-like isoform X1 [Asparagus officinalis]|uniref:uncharacterized oxidoreductase At1g06690, chloroplastic-like isoform X1 n=1 Tax=Asparagus officinalis TaxID=4686 RepID=UPI00098E83F7|nr:uncharacterized oxidoreductase At1g06690, chloroplastic-like isoform X1 [Asparagus officinalis]
MALQVSGTGFGLIHGSRGGFRVRGVASESMPAKKVEGGKVKLGGTEVKVTKLGIGAWSWGDTGYWNDSQWDDRKQKEAKAAFDASIDGGITLFDTAEVYGAGIMMGAVNSETLLGDFIKERKKNDSVEVAVATKFAALPWRFGRGSVLSALQASLSRIGLSSVDLYQLHWPGFWGNEGYIDGLGDAFEKGLVKAVGVSNYNEKQLRDAYARLKKRGIPLAANQVNYSLIYRNPEINGVKATCDELGITLIAYSPMAQGILTGKYTPERPPTGPRGKVYTPEYLTKVRRLFTVFLVFYFIILFSLLFSEFLLLCTQLQPLMTRIKEIAQNYSRSPTQVVLNWLTCQDNVIPIPGAKNAEQAKEFVGALGWRLTDEEVEELRSLAAQIPPATGLPFE